MIPAEFILMLTPGAKSAAELTGVPASITIAQAALESSWGETLIARMANNIFGVKADAFWLGQTVDVPLIERVDGKWKTVPAVWRKYESVDGGLFDHAEAIMTNPVYDKCFESRTCDDFAWGLQRGGYSNDPQYADKLIRIIHSHRLQELDHDFSGGKNDE